MSAEEQLKQLAKLSENVHITYTELRVSEVEYIQATEAHYLAKENLARAIDHQYDEGNVVGKNEREREANLRRMLPDLFNEVARLDAAVRGAERRFRVNQRDGERLALQVQIARMVLDIEGGSLPHAICAPATDADPHIPFGVHVPPAED